MEIWIKMNFFQNNNYLGQGKEWEEAKARILPSLPIFESFYKWGSEYLSTTFGKIILFHAKFGIPIFNCQVWKTSKWQFWVLLLYE